tara:strand:+ start:794 stop:1645 length:852 start_codon:yes stop_codon:yes gene_type:complete
MIKLTNPIKVSKLCKNFKFKYYGKDQYIYEFGPLSSVKKNILSFTNKDLNFTNKILIQKKRNKSKSNTLIIHKNPRLLFCKILNFFIEKKLIKSSIKKNIIDSSVDIPENCIMGNNIKIEKNCIIEPGAKIFSNVKIKKNSIIRSGAVVGCYGFGYEKDNTKKPINFPQFGSVEISENVHVGNNSCVVISTFGKTSIGKNTKIDNLVHIAHNVTIGQNCIITAKCQIAGSVKIGNNVWLSPSATIKNKVYIASNAFIGIGSVVIFDVKKNQRVFGNPAQSLIK